MSIGSRIKEVRKLRGLGQKEFAVKVGIGQSTLSELETGESKGTTYLARIATALSVNPLWLETGKGPRDIAESALGAGMAGSLNLKAETAAELQMLLVRRSADDIERQEIDDVIEEMRLRIEARARDQAKRTG